MCRADRVSIARRGYFFWEILLIRRKRKCAKCGVCLIHYVSIKVNKMQQILMYNFIAESTKFFIDSNLYSNSFVFTQRYACTENIFMFISDASRTHIPRAVNPYGLRQRLRNPLSKYIRPRARTTHTHSSTWRFARSIYTTHSRARGIPRTRVRAPQHIMRMCEPCAR